ncbi:VOC family protein [Kineococcus gypseus]|uniref:VOC family protein n=1 Tax=Kineococcus gypseus TaxID=1637102 RepID=UPI003D7D3518
MSPVPRAVLSATTLDSPDPQRLAGFWRELLGWRVVEDSEGWVLLRPHGDGAGAGLAFQRERLHRPPAWPARAGEQTQQAHLDVEVDDLAAAAERAVALGARLQEHQPQQDVRVLRDPDGHPFCLFTRA